LVSDWSSDVCSSDLDERERQGEGQRVVEAEGERAGEGDHRHLRGHEGLERRRQELDDRPEARGPLDLRGDPREERLEGGEADRRSEERRVGTEARWR